MPIPDGLVEHLASQLAKVTLLQADELTDEEKATVPAWFFDAVAHDGPDGVVAATAHWETVLPGVLGDSISLFRERALGTYLGRIPSNRGGYIVLVYVLRSDGSEPFVCWYGYPPTEHLDNPMPENARPGVRVDLTQVSEKLRTFYTQVHNWFRLIGWTECGLISLKEMFTLDWAPEDAEYEGGGDHRPDPDQVLPVFTSSNGQLCVELGTENAWMQYDSSLVSVGDLWPNVNQRIRRFTEEMATYIDE